MSFLDIALAVLLAYSIYSGYRNGLITGIFSFIGLVGGGKNTPSGSASTGAHLHMTVATMGKNYQGVEAHLLPFERLVDPLTLFK